MTTYSIWTKSELIEQLDAWKAAYKAASTGKSYTIQGRSLTRYDLKEIRDQLAYLQGELASLENGGGSKRIHMRIVR